MTGGKRLIRWLNLTVLLSLAWPQAPASAQPAAPLAPALQEPDLAAARADAGALAKQLPKPEISRQAHFDLSPERAARLKNYLPKTWLKLSQREPVHILAISDTGFEVHAQGADASLSAFPAVFAKDLADRFYYTGGVRRVEDSKSGAFGPTIALRQASHSSGGILNAAGMIEANAKQMPIDLVLLCHGQFDAASGMPAPAFATAAEGAIDAARLAGADIVLCSPWLPMGASAEVAWGGIRPLADALRGVAQQENVLFADLGNFSRLLVVPDAENADVPQVFAAIEKTYRAHFLESPAGRFRAKESLHARVGHSLYEWLLDGAPAAPWRLTQSSASLGKPDQLSLEAEFENRTDKPLVLTILPLVADGWRPVDLTPRQHVPARGKKSFKIEYSRGDAGAVSLNEAMIRLPLLVCDGVQAHIEDARAPVRPLALVWTPDTLFNQDGAFLANCQIVNNGAKDMQGAWEANLGSQKLRGSFTVKANGAFPLDLRFDLPPEAELPQVLPLTVTATSEGAQLQSARQVEVVANLGLDLPASMQSMTAGVQSDISLIATADPQRLTLTCVLPADLALEDGSDGGPAWQMDLNLDARSYGKRLERGATATLRTTGGASDGTARVHPVAPWTFGNGYAAQFDAAEFKAALSTAPDGRRLMTLVVPKTYLYLHEWALENGNSQLGINVRLTLRQTAKDGVQQFAGYALSVNPKPVEDVDSLVVLELSSKKTRRVTVNLY